MLHPRTQAIIDAMALSAGAGGSVALANYNTVGAVHQNVPMQNLILGFQFPDGMYIADQIIPPLPVVNESDLYYKMDRKPWQSRVETLTPDRAAAREVEWTWGTDVYNAERYALATSISDRERRNADNQLRLEESANLFIAQLLKLDTEVRAASLFTVAATSGLTLSGDNQFNAAAFTANGVSIEKRFDDAKEAIRQATGGFEPTHVVIPSAVAKVMKRDPTIRELIKYTTNALVNGDLPSTLWDLQVLIPKTQYTVTPENVAGTATYTDIWGDNIIFIYVPPVPGIRVPATAYQFRVTGDNYAVTQWREERRHIDMYEVSVTQDMKLVFPTGAYVLADVLA